MRPTMLAPAQTLNRPACGLRCKENETASLAQL